MRVNNKPYKKINMKKDWEERPFDPCDNCRNPNQMPDKRCGNCRFNHGYNLARKEERKRVIDLVEEDTRSLVDFISESVRQINPRLSSESRDWVKGYNAATNSLLSILKQVREQLKN